VLPQFQPMPLQKRVSAFDHPDWVFELKYDGFRALAYIESGGCRLMSRNGNQFKSFPFLNLALPHECKAKSAVLDGEIVCFDKDGCSQFEDLLFRRGEPRFLAFDCLYCDGGEPSLSATQRPKAPVKGNRSALGTAAALMRSH
jgi:bifunctional non-homologous end joining protein LigD